MSTFARTDRSELGRWWWTVDRWSLVAIVLLMGLGAILLLAASPAAGARAAKGARAASAAAAAAPISISTIPSSSSASRVSCAPAA